MQVETQETSQVWKTTGDHFFFYPFNANFVLLGINICGLMGANSYWYNLIIYMSFLISKSGYRVSRGLDNPKINHSLTEVN